MTDVTISPWYILVFVVLAVVIILCIEHFSIVKIARSKYKSDQKVYDEELKIKNGTVKFVTTKKQEKKD